MWVSKNIYITSHVEVKLSKSRESTTTNNRNEGEVNRSREGFTQKEPRDKNAKRRLTTLDDVCEWNRNLWHTHRCSHMTNCMRHSNLKPIQKKNTFNTTKHQKKINTFTYEINTIIWTNTAKKTHRFLLSLSLTQEAYKTMHIVQVKNKTRNIHARSKTKPQVPIIVNIDT